MTLDQLFKNQVQYEIPDFQRRYTWTEEDQWEPLWEDVRLRVEAYEASVKAGEPPDLRAHFLGAIVMQDRPNRANEPNRWAVIDGQQRLTTLQLLLDAAQEELEQRDSRVARFLEKMVQNDQEFWEDQPNHRLKIWPTYHDRDAFTHTMSADLESRLYRASQIGKAHVYFRNELNKWLNQASGTDAAARADALLEVLNTCLVVIAIEVESEDDANRIFETLNARGTPLRAWDLSKNFLINRFPEVASEIHLDQFDSDWWQVNVGAGRNRRNRIDHFLIDYTIMRTAANVQARTPREIFEAFRRYADSEGEGEKSIAGVMQDLIHVGRVYRELAELDDNSEWGLFLQRWRVLPHGPFRVIVLWLASEQIHILDLEGCCRILESYFARRMYCDLTTSGGGQDLLKIALDLLALLPSLQKTEVKGEFVSFFELLQDPNNRMRWPNDAEFKEALVSGTAIYDRLNQARVRMLLEAIERELRDPLSAEQGVPGHLSIEHVLPQQWAGPELDWPITSVDENIRGELSATEFRDRVKHCLGNLTLVTASLNGKMSNRSWQAKSSALDKSVLHLNKDLLNHVSEGVWDEQQVLERGRRLADLATKIWPRPQSAALPFE